MENNNHFSSEKMQKKNQPAYVVNGGQFPQLQSPLVEPSAKSGP
jgi:hypothetical protein